MQRPISQRASAPAGPVRCPKLLASIRCAMMALVSRTTEAAMDANDRTHRRDFDPDDAVDEIIRRRFRSCVTLPLFPEPKPLPPGFFQTSDIGPQLRLLDPRPCERTG